MEAYFDLRGVEQLFPPRSQTFCSFRKYPRTIYLGGPYRHSA